MKPTRYYFLTYFKRVPSAWLLIVQLCILISLPLYNNSFEEQAMSWLLGTLALIMVALVIRNSPIFTKTGMTLVVLAMTLSIWAVLSGREDLLAYAHICEAFVYFYGAAAMVMYMFDDHEVTRDELFAAAAVFTLLVWGFAFLYSVCQQWYPGSFTASVDSDAQRSWLDLLFLSFAILSGVGMSDILPVSPPARVLTAIEMFGGVMYLTLVVTRLLGMANGKLKR
ncbi:MAG: ion channel [Formosimonas sp.]